jgi:hypothetical protein
MMRTNRNHTRTALRALLSGVAALSLALAAGSSAAQSADSRYQADKTVEDYMEQGRRPAPAADDAAAEFDYAAQSLRCNIWVDRDEDEVYQRGDLLGVAFETNRDAYAVVYRIDVEGRVAVLWPRSRMDDGFVFGGHEYQLPVAGAADMRVGDREGEGFVAAVVSQYPFDLRALEIDFHHEHADKRYDLHVAGDPFLAMNEVNYAVTGLEDSAEFVITNHTRYYVHRQVDHPRYLCNQCHFEDDVVYEPYNDHCTLTISYDYHWGNSWYASYGYYPVYWNPVYAYYDPWTWRPWVNYWYWPAYTCAPYYGWRTSFWGCYTWYDSPYWGGDCYTAWNSGYRRYQPISRYEAATVARKTRSYPAASAVVAGRPTDQQRTAMSTRSPLSADRGALKVADRGDRIVRGEKPAANSRSRLDVNDRARAGSGLRIRDVVRDGSTLRSESRSGSSLRHTAAGGGSRAELAPVQRGGSVRAGGDVRQPQSGTSVRGTSRSGTAGAAPKDSRSVRTVEPRQRGSRVWNSQRSDGGRDSRAAQPEVRSRTGGGERSRSSSTVRSRTERQPSRSGSVDRTPSRQQTPQRSVQPRQAPKRDTGSKRESSVQQRSGGQNRSAPAQTPRSGGSSTRRSGGDARSRR